MPKMVTFQLDAYDGGLDQQPEPSPEGRLQLTTTHWILTFPDHDVGISAGLLRTQMDVEPVSKRSCLVRLSTDDGRSSCTMIVLAPAAKVERAVGQRMADLARACEAVDGAADGQWWLDSRVFDAIGPLRTTSVSGVRYEGGWERDEPKRPSRWPAVLDFGPEGLVLRKWRRKLTIPWEMVHELEVVDGSGAATTQGDDESTHVRGARGGTRIIVRSPSGRSAVFTSSIMATEAVRQQLQPFLEQIAAARPILSEADVAP